MQSYTALGMSKPVADHGTIHFNGIELTAGQAVELIEDLQTAVDIAARQVRNGVT
jgi:hypothetical protein